VHTQPDDDINIASKTCRYQRQASTGPRTSRSTAAVLARQIADAGFGELRRQLTYKTTWHGSVLIAADRWYPSSKTCSACGVVKAKLPLSVRVFACEACGRVIDRDLNAARNLAALVNDLVAGSGSETLNARGGDGSPGLAGQTLLKREPRTSRRLGKTGTAGPQGLAT
jgi:transposase